MLLSKHASEVLALLSDGRSHSGESMAHTLGLTRAAISKIVKSMVSAGLPVSSSRRAGYTLSHPVDGLSSEKITRFLAPSYQELFDIQCLMSCDSTNQRVKESAQQHAFACFSEHQSLGRGRRGREWLSPFAQNVYGSMGWQVKEGVSSLAGLSLAIAVVVMRGLTSLGVNNIQLKWPNDLLIGGKKLGGILIEVNGDMQGECYLTVGFGLNVHMTDSPVDQPWVSLRSAGFTINRNQLAAVCLSQLSDLLSNYSDKGFAFYKGEWDQHDYAIDRPVCLIQGNRTIEGIYKGVDMQGHVRLLHNQRLQSYSGGELSLRLKKGAVPHA